MKQVTKNILFATIFVVFGSVIGNCFTNWNLHSVVGSVCMVIGMLWAAVISEIWPE